MVRSKKNYNSCFLNIFMVLLFFSINTAGQNVIETADLIITDTRIWTGNKKQPFVEAMAIKGEKILDIGNKEEILKLKGDNTKTIELHGNFITPGFIDSHVHLLTGGFNLSSVQLRHHPYKKSINLLFLRAALNTMIFLIVSQYI